MAVWMLALLLFLPLLPALCRYAVWYWRVRKLLHKLSHHVTVRGHWLWGHLFTIHPDEATILRTRYWRRENRIQIVGAWLGPVPVITLFHCRLVAQVLKEQKHLDTYHLLLPWLGEGLLVAEGSKWQRSRRLLTPAFHVDVLKHYIGTYNSCLEVLLNRWSASARQNKFINLFETIRLLSLDIILQCAFSYKSECQKPASSHHPYTEAVYQLVECMADRFFTPLYQFDWFYYLTSSGRKMRNACKVVHAHAERVIQERRKVLALGSTKGNNGSLENGTSKKRGLDFLDILLLARDDNGEGLSDLEIRNEVDTFMFEGHDTTTSGICWTLYCLAKHPKHQEKVREEVEKVLMGREWLEYKDLKELRYTQWCIKEALRLYPPVLLIFRQTTQDIELAGHTIPKGVMIILPLLEVHRDPDIWQDPDKFDPLRFHPSNCEGRDPFAFMPFSAGHRNCIGQNFALNEEKVVVATIIQRFTLSLAEENQVEVVPKVVLRAKTDIKIQLSAQSD